MDKIFLPKREYFPGILHPNRPDNFGNSNMLVTKLTGTKIKERKKEKKI